MDVTNAFDKEIKTKTYPTLTSLQEALSKFSRCQGVKFKVTESYRYNKGDPRRKTLAYSKAVFVCVLKRTNKCPSFFVIEVRKGVLQVVERSMEHNHCRIAGDPLPVIDLTEQFEAHFKNVKLMSFNDVMTKVKAFEEATGSGFRVGRSDLFKPNEPERERYRYRRITYECVHFGQRKSVTNVSAGSRLWNDLSGTASSRSSSARLGCMAKFDVRYSPEGFRITAVVMKHNHAVSPSNPSAVGKASNRKSTQYQQRHCIECGHERERDEEISENSESFEGEISQPPKTPEEPHPIPVKRLRAETSPVVSNERTGCPIFRPRINSDNNRAPQPYWMKNPASLLSRTLPSEHALKRLGDIETGVVSTPDLNQSERHLILSGKMQRVLEKACHGDAKRFQQCCTVMDELEQKWAREDAMM